MSTADLAYKYATSGRFYNYREIETHIRLNDKHHDVKKRLSPHKEAISEAIRMHRPV